MALLQSAVLVEQPPWPFSFHARPCGWSSSGAALELAGVAVKPKPCNSCSVQERDRAGLAHTGISGAAGPLPGAAASGRLGESWKKAAGPAGTVTAWGGLPPHSPCPGAGSSPSQCAGAQGKGWGMCAGLECSCPHSGVGWEMVLILILIVPIMGCPEPELRGPDGWEEQEEEQGL